jgi:hypothetical protein
MPFGKFLLILVYERLENSPNVSPKVLWRAFQAFGGFWLFKLLGMTRRTGFSASIRLKNKFPGPIDYSGLLAILPLANNAILPSRCY